MLSAENQFLKQAAPDGNYKRVKKDDEEFKVLKGLRDDEFLIFGEILPTQKKKFVRRFVV